MELTQQMLDIPIEHMSNVFGKFDAWLKQIEKYLQVTMVVRDGSLKIMGNDNNVQKEHHHRDLSGIPRAA